MTENDALQEWFWKTRDQAELKEVTIELTTQDGNGQALLDLRRRLPGPLDAARRSPPHGDGAGHRVPRDRPLRAEDGLSRCRSRRTSSAHSWSSTAASRSSARSTRRSTRSPRRTSGRSSPSPAPTRRSPSSAAACRGRSACSSCSTRRCSGADESIKDDAIKLLKMMESGGGGGGGSAPPFVTFKWGSIESPKMVGQLAEHPLRHVPPQRRAGARARRPRAHPVRAGPAGPEPDHARDRRA